MIGMICWLFVFSFTAGVAAAIYIYHYRNDDLPFWPSLLVMCIATLLVVAEVGGIIDKSRSDCEAAKQAAFDWQYSQLAEEFALVGCQGRIWILPSSAVYSDYVVLAGKAVALKDVELRWASREEAFEVYKQELE